MAVRKFWIVNGNDDKYNLTNSELKINIVSPSGLGFQNNLSFLRVGNRDKIIAKQVAMPQVSGNIYFYDMNENAYEDYYNFVAFLSHKPLKLFYQPPNSTKSYYIDCEVKQLNKTENTELHILDCPIVLSGLSFWKDGNKHIQYFEKGSFENGKHYPLTRPYSYATFSYRNMPISNNNTMNSPFQFEINGEVVNPQLSFFQNGERYGVIKLLGTFGKVRVNTEGSNQELYLEDLNGLPITNAISYQDFSIYDGKSQMTFFDLKAGSNKLSFSADNENEFDGELKMTWEDEFVSV